MNSDSDYLSHVPHQPYEAKILADSKNEYGSRLTTMQLTYPRSIHSEFMTHRMFSRNAASSRAIPLNKMIERVETHPFVPMVWGINQKGMQAYSVSQNPKTCLTLWLEARDDMVASAHLMGDKEEQNLHKQIVNRILEPWMWITVIASGVTGAWENFFHLRCAEDAEPHINHIATMAREIYDNNIPNQLSDGEYHLPLTGFPGDNDLSKAIRIRISAARCARVSYLTHDGRRDVSADMELCSRLIESGHWSPLEHQASALGTPSSNDRGGNFGNTWYQFRKQFGQEFIQESAR